MLGSLNSWDCDWMQEDSLQFASNLGQPSLQEALVAQGSVHHG